jgi:RNA ligase
VGTTLLTDILDADLLTAMVADGYVRVQRHPDLPLAIYGYTEKAQYEQVWNAVTLTCRGLVAQIATGVVLARPFAKFFNHGQPGASAFDLDEPVVVTDKADGSLGVLYPLPSGGWAVATRGSFASEQARHATEVWRARYADRFTPPPGLTLLFEIVYPGNRIVVDYGDLDDLILLGAVDVATGRFHGPAAVADWPGPVVETFGYATFAEALAAPPRMGCEGLVVHSPATDDRLKIKYDEYVRLHRLVTGLNARVVWEHLVAGRELAELIEPLPDEFHPWVRGVAGALHADVAALAAAVESAYTSIVDALAPGWVRRDFARHAAAHPERGCLFLRLDDRDYRPLLWQWVRPAADTTPTGRTVED